MGIDADLIIIGGGAAGLAAAQYGARANLKTLVLEEMATGGQCLLIDKIENYPGFTEPTAGFSITEKFEEQARNFGAEIELESVTALSWDDTSFTVRGSDHERRSYTVILATGAKHRHLNIPGEEEFSGKGVSYCATCDGPFFRNKRIMVVGGGDAACDEALFLSNLTDKLILIHRRDRFRAQKALADRVLSNPSIEVRFNTIAEEITGNTKVNGVKLRKTDTNETYSQELEAVFIFIGSIPQTNLVPDIAKDDAGYIFTDQRMMTDKAGLFAVGDVRSTPFRQLVVAAGEGAIAAHAASGYIDELRGEAYK